ncbi:hypothetical protein CVT24_006013, partial [Panaeolus cyanescens]
MQLQYSAQQPDISVTDYAYVSPTHSEITSSSDLTFSSSSSSNSSVSIFAEHTAKLSSSTAPQPPISKTFIPARCHCGLNSFIAVFPKSKKHTQAIATQTHSYPNSTTSISSKFNLAPTNLSSPSQSPSSSSSSIASDPSQHPPILSNLCHCSTCRHVSGQLAAYHIPMLEPPLAAPSRNTSLTHSRTTSRPLSPDEYGHHMSPPSAAARVKTRSPYLGLGKGADMGFNMISIHGLGGAGNDAGGLISALNAVVEDDGLERVVDETSRLGDDDAKGNGDGNGEADSEDEWVRPFDLLGLEEYRTSEGVSRLFCRSCGAHLFYVVTRLEGDASPSTNTNTNGGATANMVLGSTNEMRKRWKWSVAGGVLERTAGIAKVGRHVWVGDTYDGGLADHLRVVDGVVVPRFKEGVGSEEVEVGWNKVIPKAIETQSLPSLVPRPRPRPHHSGASERLPLHCHCGAIRLLITRPTYESTFPHVPFPDILCPSYARLSKKRNPRDLKWWLRPPLGHPVPSNIDPEKNASHATRYLAGHCMCGMCRGTGGMEVGSWVWVPGCNVLDERTGTPVVFDYEGVGGPVFGGGGDGGGGGAAREGMRGTFEFRDNVVTTSMPELQRRSRAGAVAALAMGVGVKTPGYARSILSDGDESPTFTASPESSGRTSPVGVAVGGEGAPQLESSQNSNQSLNSSNSNSTSHSNDEKENEDISSLYLPSGRLKALHQYTPSPGRHREFC